MSNAPPWGERQLLLGCIALFSIASLTALLVPQILYGAMSRFQLSAGDAGLFPTSEALVIGLGSMLLSARPIALAPRTIGLASLALWMAANIASPFAPTFVLLLLCRLLSGLAGACMLFTATTLAATLRNPDRAYAVMNALCNIFAALVVAGPPLLMRGDLGLNFLLFGVAASLLWLPFLHRLPTGRPSIRSPLPGDHSKLNHGPRPFVRLLPVAAALCLLTFQGFTNFTFSIGFGLALGLAEAEVNMVLSIGGLLSGAGAIAAALLPTRLGRLLPIMAVLLTLTVTDYVMTRTTSIPLFNLCLVTVLTALNFMLPLFLGWAAAHDPSGRSSAAMMGAFVITNALAPTLGGHLVDAFSLQALGAVAIVTGVAAAMLLILGVVLTRQPVAAQG